MIHSTVLIDKYFLKSTVCIKSVKALWILTALAWCLPLLVEHISPVFHTFSSLTSTQLCTSFQFGFSTGIIAEEHSVDSVTFKMIPSFSSLSSSFLTLGILCVFPRDLNVSSLIIVTSTPLSILNASGEPWITRSTIQFSWLASMLTSQRNWNRPTVSLSSLTVLGWYMWHKFSF